jgi:hypothetical protein
MTRHPPRFPTARQCHANFPKPACALDYIALLRLLAQQVFERPKVGFGPELLNPFREPRGFDE